MMRLWGSAMAGGYLLAALRVGRRQPPRNTTNFTGPTAELGPRRPGVLDRQAFEQDLAHRRRPWRFYRGGVPLGVISFHRYLLHVKSRGSFSGVASGEKTPRPIITQQPNSLITEVASDFVDALRLVRVDLPGGVIRGDSVRLNCSFDLENDKLYSVKWYKGNREFFRYIPSETPPSQTYYLPGVHVDAEQSNMNTLVLSKTEISSEDVYKCEVSADAPSFQTIRAEKELKIYVLPEKGPEIVGIRPQYDIGDIVNVTCHAGLSKPAGKLDWFINGEYRGGTFNGSGVEIRSGWPPSTFTISWPDCLAEGQTLTPYGILWPDSPYSSRGKKDGEKPVRPSDDLLTSAITSLPL
ncbi:hypothetical protein BIW11_12018 [Tropilaelaps mercedesae]|uniref:Ig-like domain-containing protein n=1 Tax=Tropilaelaps mercedesae TaxID=418985 RepID=A0A1V9X8I2_9ACAR|nr:hypothetical protein BIW11_12018 [Tropilaelaps mercedesae]